MKPFLLQSVCKDYVWGGNRLRTFGKTSDADRIAESWELSCHPDGESRIASGEFAGLTLTAFLTQHPEALGANCRKADRFPVLIKLIDAQKNLSVQVHPGDAYALANEGEPGKTELWYIIDAAPGAEILYGVKEAMTQTEFRESIETGTITEKLRHIPVHPGEVYFIPAGTLHAIGAGCLVAEVQENSNTTYRVYDYGRGRALHIDKAMDVTTLRPIEAEVLSRPVCINGWRAQHLSDCDYFYVTLWEPETAAPAAWRVGEDTASFLHILVLDGSGTVQTADGERLLLEKGASLFIPAGAQKGRIAGNLRFIVTEMDQKQ